ncbi:MAG: hypothetical protein CVV51_08660 [Spirochaetae bacterium HGW-Spirochaetae-7]|jgi:hypothetical protein|nr:MAG: hypothetical protein CVV51_08660 [Spirochaetae bacterium HGW-Spirochaetae-7]
MTNRFVRRIREGDIATPEALKAEFKALAKSTHPDLAGPGAELAFIRVREDYESALRDFERHRFGDRVRASQPGPAGGGDTVRGAFAAMGLLRRRGFPKSPRHRKETLRYDYARWCCTRAMARADERAAAAFEPFERSMLELKARRGGVASDALRYLDALVEYAAIGLPELRTALLVDLGSLRTDPRLPADALGFLSVLSAWLGIGTALPV